MARLQQLSGARVAALEEDWALMEQAAKRPGRNNSAPPPIPKRDMIVKEGETLTLRWPDDQILQTSRPHSRFAVGRVHRVRQWPAIQSVHVRRPGPRGGVQGATQFLETTKRIAEIPGIEVHVQVHSWLASYPYPNGGIFERAQKLAQRKAGEPNPFVDEAAWKDWVKTAQAGAEKYLAEQKQKGAP